MPRRKKMKYDDKLFERDKYQSKSQWQRTVDAMLRAKRQGSL